MRRMPNFGAIIKQLQQERDNLDRAIAALTSLDGGHSHKSQRRTMSAAARRRIAAAQRARWARQRSTVPSAPGAGRPKHRISPEGIARIRAAAKARWAKTKAAKKK